MLTINIINILTETFFVCTQKNRLDENGSFEYPKHMIKSIGKKYLQFYAENVCLLIAILCSFFGLTGPIMGPMF